MKNSSALLMLFTFLVAGKCNKDRPDHPNLPAATETGANSIAFKKGDEIWLPFSRCGIGQDPCGEMSVLLGEPDTEPNALQLQVGRVNGQRFSTLSIDNYSGSTITTIGEKIDSVRVQFISEEYTGNPGIFESPQPGSSFLVTKLDKVNRIISGTFQFNLVERNNGANTLRLAEGRFDFKYNTCTCR